MKKVKMRNIAKPSMAKAIRAKCMDCSGEQPPEVRECPLMQCPLWPYRFGCNPAAYINRNKDNIKLVK